MKNYTIIILALILLSLCGTSALHAFEHKTPDIVSGKVPALVAGVIVLHGAGIATSMLLSDKDFDHRGVDFNQDQVFYVAESMCQTQSGREEIFSTYGSYGVGKMFRPWLAGIVKGNLIEFQSKREHTYGTSLDGEIRLIFLNKDKIKLHYNCGFGVCLTDKEFPDNGTKTNFISFFGVGSMFRIAPGVNWKIGYRHVHISNGGLIAGDDRNPGFDSNGIFTGLMFFR